MTLIIISYRTRSIKLTKRLQPRGAHRCSLAREDNHCHVKIPTLSYTPNNSPSPFPHHFWSTLIDIIYHLFYYFPEEWRAERNTATTAVRWLIKLGYPDLWGRGNFAYNHPVSKQLPTVRRWTCDARKRLYVV